MPRNLSYHRPPNPFREVNGLVADPASEIITGMNLFSTLKSLFLFEEIKARLRQFGLGAATASILMSLLLWLGQYRVSHSPSCCLSGLTRP